MYAVGKKCVEVKTNFQQYSSKHLAHFATKYQSEPGIVIALLGTLKSQYHLYPWQFFETK